MTRYVFIATRDPETDRESREIFELAGSLSRERNLVTVYLSADAVTVAHATSAERWLVPLLRDRVRVFVDPLALEQHRIADAVLARGVVPAAIETLVDRWAA